MSNIREENPKMQKYQSLYSLTEDQRLDAKERARALIVRRAGEKPQLEQFQRTPPPRPNRDQYADTFISRYPEWLTKAVMGVMLLVFAAAAMPSLFRLFTAGRDYFSHGITDPIQAAVVGVSTFLLAEFLIVLSTISARVYFTGWSRVLFVVPIGMGLAVALVGNWTITRPTDVFGWLETVVPPVSVVFIALVLEKLILDSIHSRHANEKAYQTALRQWQQSVQEQQQAEEQEYRQSILRWQDMTRDPETSADWTQVYATALREAIKTANSHGTGKTARVELMSSLNSRDWTLLVKREMKADRWYEMIDQVDEVVAEASAEAAPAPVQEPAHALPTIEDEEEETQEARPFAVNGNSS